MECKIAQKCVYCIIAVMTSSLSQTVSKKAYRNSPGFLPETVGIFLFPGVLRFHDVPFCGSVFIHVPQHSVGTFSLELYMPFTAGIFFLCNFFDNSPLIIFIAQLLIQWKWKKVYVKVPQLCNPNIKIEVKGDRCQVLAKELAYIYQRTLRLSASNSCYYLFKVFNS